MAVTPTTHLEKSIAGAVQPVTHLEKVIAEYGGGGSGGSVTSVNGKTGAVMLDADDVGAAPAETVVTVSEAAPTIAPAANTIYNCRELTSLTITDSPAAGSYSIVFTSGATATTTTFPATILGLEDFAAEANTMYEINVLDNRAVVGSWAVSSGE